MAREGNIKMKTFIMLIMTLIIFAVPAADLNTAEITTATINNNIVLDPDLNNLARLYLLDEKSFEEAAKDLGYDPENFLVILAENKKDIEAYAELNYKQIGLAKMGAVYCIVLY